MGNPQHIELGSWLRKYRTQNNFGGIKTVAKTANVDYSTLSKIENGLRRPSRKMLEKLIDFYKLNVDQARNLFYLSGEREGVTIVEESSKNKDVNASNPFQGKNVNIPQDKPILYAGGVYIYLKPNGMVMDFAQQVGPTNHEMIVARIGMSTAHAERFAKSIMGLIEKGKGKDETIVDK